MSESRPRQETSQETAGECGPTKDIILLFSGGADSLLMLIMAMSMACIRKVHVVMFQYGQKHEEELKYAKLFLRDHAKMTAAFGSKYLKITESMFDLRDTFTLFKSNLLKDSGFADYPGVHPMHVPARNTIFLATAMGFAETLGAAEIWHGADYSDRVGLFPDCYQEYFVRMNEVAKIAGSSPITIKAPLLGMTKDDVIQLLRAYGVDMQTVYSGYQPPTVRVNPDSTGTRADGSDR